MHVAGLRFACNVSSELAGIASNLQEVSCSLLMWCVKSNVLCRLRPLSFRDYKEAFEEAQTQSGEKYLLTFDID